MVKKIFNKKAQIGVTLTWFAAFLIIFFIVIIFVSATATLGVKKIGDYSNVKLIPGESGLDMQRELITILNTPTEDGKTIQELIMVNDKERVEKSVKKIFENKGKNCYLFSVGYEEDKSKSFSVTNELQKYHAITNVGSALAISEDKAFLNNLEGLSEINLYSNNQKINVKSYTERC